MKNDQEIQNIELMIGKILRIGVFISSAVMIIGLVMFVATAHSGYSGTTYPHSFSNLVHGLVQFKPFAWMMTGLFLLILTPILRVISSIFAFAKEKDRLYVLITLGVFIILMIAVFIGHSGN